jgi:DNA modification methylase
MRQIASLREHPSNARTHSKKQIREIANSIRTFGFTNPVLIAEDGTILAGHGRVRAAKIAGIAEVPTICLSHLNADQRRAYLLADNKLALNAGWDLDLLAQELEVLGELSFDLPTLGFSNAEVDVILSEAKEAKVDRRAAREDRIPPMMPSVTTRQGDLWLLDRHKLLAGDARERDSYEVLLGSEEVGMMFTDPPYNVPIDGHVCGSGRIRHREFAMGVGEMNRSEFTKFLFDSLSPAAGHCRDGAIAYVCMDWRHLHELISAAEKVFSEHKNVCVWNKKSAGQGTFYRSKHEMILVFKVGKAPHVNNFGLGGGGRYRTNVWDYPGISGGGPRRLLDLEMHPTVKPVALVEDAIRDCSARGDIVLDQFGGSGTTLIAAHRSGRIGRLIEFDPAYCDVIIRRFEALSGKQARLAVTGKTFEETEEQRRDGKQVAGTLTFTDNV